ncbi:Rhodanese-like domain-containing protein [Phlyctochytrium arcticum]|nr:Rhodanese-like domain-containing protein [Phlyctochytrium arcticum]
MLPVTKLAARQVFCARPLSRAFSQTPVTCGLFGDHINKLKKNVKEITPIELGSKILKDPEAGPASTLHLLDVRETYEWNEEHIPFAVYTGKGCLERDIEGIVPDQHDEIVLYCAGGHRSIVAADSLQKMGYSNVSSLAGGIGGWKKEGLTLVQNFRSYSERVPSY